MSQTLSSAFNPIMTQPMVTHSSINMVDWSVSSLLDIASSHGGAHGGAQGGAQFETFMTAMKDATSVLGCQQVQQQPDCSVAVHPQLAQQQQELPMTVSVNPPPLNPPSLQTVSLALHQDGSRSGTPTLRTPTTIVLTPTPHDEKEDGKKLLQELNMNFGTLY